LHARIAEALERLFGGSGEIQPELLARHFTDGGLGDRAIPCWRQAGALAAGRSANVEAIAHLGKGLELIATLPDADEELALRLALGGPLIATRGYPAPEVEQNYTRALALCEQLGRSADLLPLLRGLWNCCFIRGELQTAYELAKRLVALADEQGGPLRHAHTCRALGSTLFCLGRLTDASEQLERGIALDRTVEDLGEHRAHALLHLEHPGAFCRMYLAWALWLLGYPDRALETLKEALDLGQRLAHPYSMATPPAFASVLHNWRGEFSAAREQADAVIATAGEHQLPLMIAIGTIVRGSALVGLGERKEGTAQLRSGLAAWNGVGAHLLDTQWFGLTAEACLRMGKFDNALIALDRAAEIAAATGKHYYQAELCRLRGLVLAKTGKEAEAAASLQRAIDTARSQQARSLELRAATSLARLWADQGERQKAHDLLAPVHAWFTEGFETADLRTPRRCSTRWGDQAFARASTAWSRTLAPSVQASGEAYSISAWLIPSLHGTKIIAVGATRAM